MIIGITGTNGAGKGTVVEFLKTRGFKHYSVRDFLTMELERKGLEVNRENMVNIGNELRSRFGPSYIAEELYRIAERDGGDVVIESIRTLGEVEALRKKENFILFAVDADPEIRYQRIVERGISTTDKISFEDFLREEEREMSSMDPNKQNLKGCMEAADHLFKNDWTVEELHNRVSSVLGKRGSGEKIYVRPSWDEYFIEISKTAALRGTCDRGRSGAVIAKDKQILVTGYVGSPKGLPHCDEAGHLMEEWIHSDGVKRMHCVRTTHAEQNAICQAAKLGISIDGATLYCKMAPCSSCAGMIINSGIKRVVCEKNYHGAGKTPKMFEQAGVKLEVMDEEVEKYVGM